MLLAELHAARIAFPLADVIEILPAMACTPLPEAPAVVRGLVNLHGAPLPLLDLRVRLGMSPREARPTDHVVVCRVGGRDVGVWVDRAVEVTHLDPDRLVDLDGVAQAEHVAGAVLLDDGLLLVQDVRSFLDADEELCLEAALAGALEGASDG